MHFKDMKWYMKALMGVLVILLSPVLLLAIIATLVSAIVSPWFEMPYYARSAYYRTFGEKYSWFITSTPRFRVFRRLRKRRPDVAFPPAGTDRFHCFTCGTTLIYFGIFDRFVYDTEKGEWCAAASENDEPRELSEALAEYPHKPDGEKYPTTDVKILACAELFYEENLYRAYDDPRFIIYKNSKDLKKKLLEL
ncbi:MAG: hypothetical protein IJX39_00100 [Clostridia bacterium]|nr:hypothetical protein [Clostridia bacterium]